MSDRPTRRQLQVMRRIAGGLLLLAESNGECWLFDRAYCPVERITTVLAERLVLGGWVRGSGELTPKGKAAVA